MATMDSKEVFLPLIYREWDDILKEKAAKDINEVESAIPSEIAKLKRLIAEENLSCQTDDDFLLWFLRCKKHDIRRSFEQLKLYIDSRHYMMNFYGFMFFTNLRKSIESGAVGLLPKRDDEGHVILYIRPGQWNRNVCEGDDVVRTIQSLFHFAMDFPATQVNGYTVIFDCSVPSIDVLLLAFRYIKLLGPTIKCFPARFQKICIVNCNILVRGLVPLFLRIIPPKLRGRTQFYGDAKTSLPNVFHPSILPEEFGGTMGSLDSLYKEWLYDYEKYLLRLHATNKIYKSEDTISYPESEQIWLASCKEDKR